GIRHEEPDLFEFPAEPGDRVFVCSDGACGTLSHERIADILGSGTPDFAAVELVRASLEAGSTDNVTCIVADVSEEPPGEDLVPLLVGAAADLPRRMPLAGAVGGLFRGHRSGDTGEIPPVPGDVPEGAFAADPIDPEAARYAPRAPRRYAWLRRLMVLALVLGVAWMVLAAGWSWSQQQFYVADHDGNVAIFRGIDADLPGLSLSHPYEVTDVELAKLSDIDAETVREGIESDSLDDARATVDNYAAIQEAS
ncbi:MAG TPA: serine/threonine-protein phosphatase, partial [Nocardioides sp.]